MAVRRTKVASTEDSAPKSANPSRPSYSGGGGWGAPSAPRRDVVKAPYLSLMQGSKSTPKVIKILSDRPDLWHLQHFIGKGKPPVMCYRSGADDVNPELTIAREMLEQAKGDCPMCAVGAPASYGFMLNVIDMTEDGTEVRKWTFGNNVKYQLMALTEESRTSPLNRETDDEGKYRPLYWRVQQSKVNGSNVFSITPLKGDDLRDDYNLEPLTEDEVNEFADKRYGEEVLFYWPVNKMREFADGFVRAQANKDDE